LVVCSYLLTYALVAFGVFLLTLSGLCLFLSRSYGWFLGCRYWFCFLFLWLLFRRLLFDWLLGAVDFSFGDLAGALGFFFRFAIHNSHIRGMDWSFKLTDTSRNSLAAVLGLLLVFLHQVHALHYHTVFLGQHTDDFANLVLIFL